MFEAEWQHALRTWADIHRKELADASGVNTMSRDMDVPEVTHGTSMTIEERKYYHEYKQQVETMGLPSIPDREQSTLDYHVWSSHKCKLMGTAAPTIREYSALTLATRVTSGKVPETKDDFNGTWVHAVLHDDYLRGTVLTGGKLPQRRLHHDPCNYTFSPQ